MDYDLANRQRQLYPNERLQGFLIELEASVE